MLNSDTKRKIQSARDILVGKIPDPKSQVEQITLALMFKFMDDMDKDAISLGGKAKFFSGNFSEFSWSKILNSRLGAQERLNLYAEALEKMDDNPNIPQLFRNIFKNAFLPYRDPETLSMFLKQINEFEYSHSEQLGDAFEFLLSIMASQGDAGQFRTPRHIIDFIVAAVDPDKNQSILDPACGTAGFLISAYKHILEKNKEKGLTPDEKGFMAKNYTGYDISPDMVRLSLVNMYLHGFADPQIHEYDSLSSTRYWDDKYDVILANPPFMTPKGGIKPHNRFSIQANRSEVLFVDYILEHLTINGKAGIIVPEGIIFQSANAYKQLRKKLVEDGLFCVVSLPAGVFQPYSGVKTSILLFNNEIAKKMDDIIFIKIENDGFDLGAQRRATPEQNDLPLALMLINSYKRNIASGNLPKTDRLETLTEKTISILVPKSRIRELGDYYLTGDRYKKINIQNNQKWPMVKLEEACSFEYGKSLPERNRKQGPYPVMGSNGRSGFHNEYLVKGPAIIVGRKGSAGEIVWEEENCFPIDTTYYVKLRDEKTTDLRYIFFIFPSLNLKELRDGAGIPGLNRNDAYKIKIPLPPLEIQKRIVAELDGYKNIIDGAKQVIANWRQKIEIDPEWEKNKFGEIAKNLDGKRKPVTKSDRTKGIYPYYGASGIVDYVDDYLFDEELLLVSEDGANLIARSTPIAFSVKGKVWINNHAHVLRFERIETQKFVEFYLNQIDLKDYITGAAQPKLNQASLNNIHIPLPPLEIQKQIVAKIEEEQKLVDANKKLIEIYEQKIKDKIAEIWG